MKPNSSQSGSQHDPALLQALAEASAWIVTLHGPDRSPAVDRGFRQWLAERPIHRQAFEHTTDTWTATRASVRRSAEFDVRMPGELKIRPRRSYRRTLGVGLAASILAALALTAYYFLSPETVATAVGERRSLVLEDGTRVTLNTSTKIRVRYSRHSRYIGLDSGEALFEVAGDATRPFVVEAGNRKVAALGTAFIIRRDNEETAVTLVEGRVAVTSSGSDQESASTVQVEAASEPVVAPGVPTVLVPGERIVFAGEAAAKVDRPQLDKLTAWQQGLINIDDMTLAQAVAEMNRYSTTELIVEGPAAALHVSGVFRTADSENMAKALASIHGLQMKQSHGRIVLSDEIPAAR